MEFGNWKCYRQAVDVPYPPYERTQNWESIPDQTRRKREAEFETPQNPESSSNMARWSGGKKPQNFICLVKCQKGYTLSGNYIGVCRENTQQWIVPPVAFCNERPKKPKMCKKPDAENGSYSCEEFNRRLRREASPRHHGEEH